MATVTAPSREDFAKLLDESFGGGNLQDGSVIKGKVVAVEKEFAVIDVGLKTEGRVALREFTGPGRQAALKVGARRVGASWRRPSTTARRFRALSSTRSRAASPSISTAPLPSCRARRSISVRSATSHR